MVKRGVLRWGPAACVGPGKLPCMWLRLADERASGGVCAGEQPLVSVLHPWKE